MHRKRICMSFMSITLPSVFLLSVAAATTVAPPDGERVASGAKQYLQAQCTAAALSTGDPINARREVRLPGTEASTRATPAVHNVVEWYYGATPGRYVAVVDATRDGRPVQVRASVDLRNPPCRLSSWAVGDGAPRVAATGSPPSASSSGTPTSATTASAPAAPTPATTLPKTIPPIPRTSPKSPSKKS